MIKIGWKIKRGGLENGKRYSQSFVVVKMVEKSKSQYQERMTF